ncbi:Arginyl-tRNA--protein transferase 1 [Sporothrix epigloea]|uniref:Arginyl-tRNA--protein transferase 1 n=1 Tax=Sporothrix epigloea TaxID=1892477 RepID=A0ABP0DGR6_9PEZI
MQTQSEATQATPFGPVEQRTPTTPAQKFEVSLEPDTYDDEKYAVFENYQRIVHKESASTITKQGFTSFLCGSPIRRGEYTDDQGRRRQLGSFHQCYRLDGRLVAIGVLDLLPECVSSVYFFYHESIHAYSPGKLSAMREIALASELGYRWWYSGYYIHSCPKMQYKLDFSPQYVLDPEVAGSWDLLDKKALKLFDKQPYVSLSHERAMALKRESGTVRVSDVPRECDVSPTTDAFSHDSNSSTANNVEDQQATEASDVADEAEVPDDDSENEEHRSLFMSNMPALPSLREIATYQLDKLPVRNSQQPEMFPINCLVAWHRRSFYTEGLKNSIAELVAMVGSDLIDQLCLDYRRD